MKNSKSQSDLIESSSKLNMQNTTVETTTGVPKAPIPRNTVNSISSVVKNFRDSLTNFGTFESTKESNATNTVTNVKVRDVKMRDRAKNNSNISNNNK